MDFFDIYEKEVRQQYEHTQEPETGMFEVEEMKERNTNEQILSNVLKSHLS